MQRANHEKLEAVQRLFAEGRNEAVLERCTGLERPWPGGVTFYYAAALINLEQRVLAAQVLSEALPQTEGCERADLMVLEGVLSAYRGDSDTYAQKAAEANALCATPHTLYHLGMATGHLDERLSTLQASLIAAEEAEDDYAEARNAHALAAAHLDAGHFKAATGWLRYAEARARHPGLRLSVTNLDAYLRLLTGDIGGLEATLRATLETDTNQAYTRHKVQTRLILADLYQATERYDRALDLYTEALSDAPRALRAWLTLGYVRAQCALGDVAAAREQAEATVVITEGLAAYHRQQARLALALARWPEAEALEGLSEAHTFFRAHDSALAIEAAFHLAAYEGIDDALRRAITPTLESARIALTEVGLRFLAGRAFGSLAELSSEVAALKIFVLGRLEVHLGGKPLTVRQRSVELVLLLASNPRGFSPEALSDALYGEFQGAGLRVELHRLRKALGLEVAARPYRLLSGVWSDLTELEALLAQGRVHEAVGLYRGPLLPQSTAPAIVERRHSLEAELQAAVLHTSDTELIWELAQIMPFDLELWEVLVARLAQDDPRYSVAAGRSARVRSELEF